MLGDDGWAVSWHPCRCGDRVTAWTLVDDAGDKVGGGCSLRIRRRCCISRAGAKAGECGMSWYRSVTHLAGLPIQGLPLVSVTSHLPSALFERQPTSLDGGSGE